jgi:hypothetical protein
VAKPDTLAESMARQHVLINLRIPSLSVRPPDEPPKRIDNSEVRFTRVVELPAIPKREDVLDVTIAEGTPPLRCTVTMVNWDERENRFVVACWAKPPMRESDYRALLASPDWAAKPLL